MPRAVRNEMFEVVRLAEGEQKLHRVAEPIAGRMNLRAESAAENRRRGFSSCVLSGMNREHTRFKDALFSIKV